MLRFDWYDVNNVQLFFLFFILFIFPIIFVSANLFFFKNVYLFYFIVYLIKEFTNFSNSSPISIPPALAELPPMSYFRTRCAAIFALSHSLSQKKERPVRQVREKQLIRRDSSRCSLHPDNPESHNGPLYARVRTERRHERNEWRRRRGV